MKLEPIKNKIDFAVIFTVENANPNGDPLNGNRPRTNIDGLGEVSDVCIKRKIRNRLQDMGKGGFVQSDDRSDDGMLSLRGRAEGLLAEFAKDEDKFVEAACNKWIDVRAFGQVFAFKKKNTSDGISIGVRGPVSIRPAFSISPVNVSSIQITKSVNSEDSDKKGSDTMGMKHRVDCGTYIFYGSINPQLASKTGFSDADAKDLKEALKTLFVNDSSSARPDGSMDVVNVYWWEHNCPSGQYSSAKVHNSLKLIPKVDDAAHFEDYEVLLTELDNLKLEIY